MGIPLLRKLEGNIIIWNPYSFSLEIRLFYTWILNKGKDTGKENFVVDLT